MANPNALGNEHTSDHQVSMALTWVPFRAHERYSMVMSTKQHAVDAGAEEIGLGHLVVVHVPFIVVVLAALWPTTKFLPEEDVTKSIFEQ